MAPADLPVATTSALGAVKPDGTTITIASGEISAVSGAGGIDQLTGDVLAGPGSGSQAATLATVNSDVGSFTSANITVNAKGLVTAAANGSTGSTGSTGSSLVPSPPYWYDGTHYYTPDAYQVTLPPTSGTVAWINSVAPGSVASGTNGNLICGTTGTGTAYFQTLSAAASVEAVFSLQFSDVNGNGGVWLWDQTNGYIYVLLIDVNSQYVVSLATARYTYNGSGSPTAGGITHTFGVLTAGVSSLVHLKVVKSGSTILYQISTDGGISYQTLGTQAVGTIAKGGINFYDWGSPMQFNLFSLVCS
jgi:hypothetical protein